ncbi:MULTISPECIES: methylenetetrahydrofolate reductase [Acidithrix]|uniref:Methylenetetrahydrofolate reductase n=1 Tax=Acidithrix ferrooxidans TaxID=1280514 RepID=A0A0D8HED2_9ACTN|nr:MULTISPECIES: methylenetetrahydrofolate reductase [Acidithrix]KJF16244.1 5,10-methylenetetrahydrofolate reductase [Acidithrix ferrooxidans]
MKNLVRVDQLISSASRPLFSVELWPPRNVESERRLTQALLELSELSIDFVSITYGAGGSTRENTHDLVVKLDREYSLTAVAHLVTAAHSKVEIDSILSRYAKGGIVNLLALHGDPPLSGNDQLLDGEFPHAIDLARYAIEKYDMCVGVAAHPQGHPSAFDRESDIRFLAEKLEVAHFGITQFFYDSNYYFDLLSRLDSIGIQKPIIPGIMAPTSLSTLIKMSELSGAEIPKVVLNRLNRYQGDPQSLKKEGIEIAIELSQELLDGGVAGIHVFTMNQASTTKAIYSALFPGRSAASK